MAGQIGALAFILAVCALLGWLLWYALAKGRLPAYGGGWVERAKSPITFWFGFIVFAAIFLPFVGMLVISIGWLVTGTKPPGT